MAELDFIPRRTEDEDYSQGPLPVETYDPTQEEFPSAVPYLPETVRTAQQGIDAATAATGIAAQAGNIINQSWNPEPDQFDFRPAGMKEGLELAGTAMDLANIGMESWFPVQYEAPPRSMEEQGLRQIRDYGWWSAGGKEGPDVLPGGVALQDTGELIPRIIAPPQAGPTEQIAAGTLNTGAMIPNFVMSPMGFTTLLLPEVFGPAKVATSVYSKYISPIIKGYFAGTMAKGAGEQLGAASVSGNIQDWTEGILTGGFAGALPFLKEGKLLPRTQSELEARIERRMQDAAQKGLQPQGGVPEYQGTEATRVSTETSRGNRPISTTRLAEETQVLLNQAVENNRTQGLGTEVELVPQGIGRTFQADPAIVDAEGNFVRPGKITGDISEIENTRATMNPVQFLEYVQTALVEEGLHSLVTPKEARAYYDSLTWAERKLMERVYRGIINADTTKYSPELLGHEFLRQRLQRAMKYDLTEFVQIARAERWTLRGLEMMANTIRRIRETLKTDAALAGRGLSAGILDRAERNIAAAAKEVAANPPPEIDEVTGEELGGEQPFAPERRIKFENEKERESFREWFSKWEALDDYRVQMRQIFEGNGSRQRMYEVESALYALSGMKRPEQLRYMRDLDWTEAEKRALSTYLYLDKQVKELGDSPHFDTLAAFRGRGYTGEPHIGPSFGLSAPARRKPYGFWIDALGKANVVGQEGHHVAANALMGGEQPWEHLYDTMEQRGYRRASTSYEDGRKTLFIDIPASGLSTAVEKAAKQLGEEYGYDVVQGIYNETGKRKTIWQNPEAEERPFAPQRRTTEEQKAEYNRYWELRKKIQAAVKAGGARISPEEIQQIFGEIEQIKNRNSGMPPRWPEYPGGLVLAPKRRGKPDTGTPEMFMPQVQRGEQVERGRPTQPITPNAVQQAAEDHFARAKAENASPDFDTFKGELERDFGPMSRDAVFYAWQDAVVRQLMNATGAELDRLVDQYKLRADIARALKPQEADPHLGHGRIPDKLEMPQVQMQLGEIAKHFQQRQWRTAAAWRKQFGPAQQIRYAAVGALLDKMMAEAGPVPKKPWDRTTIGPEDVAQISTVVQPGTEREVEGGTRELTAADIASVPAFRAIPIDLRNNPVKLGEYVTTGAAIDASGEGAPPRTVTKNVVALHDQFGKVVVVSTWRDPRAGPKIANPEVASLPGKKIDADLLKKWTPFYVAHLREPVRNFRQVFRNQAEFDAYWGGLIEGTEGLRTSSFVGPNADVANAAAGMSKVSRPLREEFPPELTEQLFVSETGRELEMPEGRKIPTGSALYRMPRPEPPVTKPGELPAEPGAFDFRPVPEGEVANPPFSYGKPTGKITEVGKPEKMGPGWPLREGAMKGTYYAGEGARYVPSTRRYPTAAMRRQKVTANELWQRFRDALSASYKRREMMKDIPRMLGGAENAANMEALLAGNFVRLASGEPLMVQKPTGKEILTDPLQSLQKADAYRKEKKEKRETAYMNRVGSLAYIATGTVDPRNGRWRGNYHFLKDLDDLLSAARTQAFAWENGLNPQQKIVGRRWRLAVEEMQESIDWARRHWRDPKFRQTVDAVRQVLGDEIAFENAHGFKVKERTNYVPNRYEPPFFADNTINFGPNPLRGRAFKKARTFNNMFEAIAYGPYIPASLDAADLAQHRVNSGRRSVMRQIWLEELMSFPDPDSGEPVAMKAKAVYEEKPAVDPATGIHYTQKNQVGWMEPNANYRLVKLGRGEPIAVRESYYRLVDMLVSDSKFDHMPLGREALLAAGIVKHGILLLIDTFHLGRLTDYQMALLGKKVGFRGGVSSLMLREADLNDAVTQGWITREAADWARERIPIQHVGPRAILNTTWMTRQQMAHELVKQGLNATKITDALYKDVVQRIPFIGKTWHSLFGWYNHWLFDQYVPGMIVESAVRYAEKFNKQHPSIPFHRIMKDVITDTNIYFGNLGRQSAIKSATWRDLAQVTLLAPMWLEGLIQKDIRFYSRATGLSYVLGRRKVPYMGLLGTGIGRGLLAFTVLTQMLNLITRGQPTWQNPEEGHKMDAWIPIRGGKEGEGFWLSPMSIFSEVVHDIARLTESKGNVRGALMQIGGNKLGPVGKMIAVFLSGKAPTGEVITSTPKVLWTAAKQLTPAPIAFGTPIRAALHKAMPETISPPRRGALTQQLLASLASLKVQSGLTPLQEVKVLARKFMEEEGLDPNTMVFLPTDMPSYAKFRAAVRNDDRPGARQLLEQLREKHTDAKIRQAMEEWAQAPITNSRKNDRLFKNSLDDRQLDLFYRALWEKKEELELIKEFLREN